MMRVLHATWTSNLLHVSERVCETPNHADVAHQRHGARLASDIPTPAIRRRAAA